MSLWGEIRSSSTVLARHVGFWPWAARPLSGVKRFHRRSRSRFYISEEPSWRSCTLVDPLCSPEDAERIAKEGLAFESTLGPDAWLDHGMAHALYFQGAEFSKSSLNSWNHRNDWPCNPELRPWEVKRGWQTQSSFWSFEAALGQRRRGQGHPHPWAVLWLQQNEWGTSSVLVHALLVAPGPAAAHLNDVTGGFEMPMSQNYLPGIVSLKILMPVWPSLTNLGSDFANQWENVVNLTKALQKEDGTYIQSNLFQMLFQSEERLWPEGPAGLEQGKDPQAPEKYSNWSSHHLIYLSPYLTRCLFFQSPFYFLSPLLLFGLRLGARCNWMH